MDDTLYRAIYQHQKNHWFFKAKRYFFNALVKASGAEVSRKYVADVGCGTGPLVPYLQQFGGVIGVDASPVALGYIRQAHSVPLVCAKADTLPFSDNTVGMVCLSDILYHKNVENDAAVLRDCFRALAPGGVLLFSDSAFRILAGEHDALAHSARRYSAREVREKLAASGFRVKRVSYAFMTLFPVVLAVRTLQKIIPKKGAENRSDFKPASVPMNTLMRLIFFGEALVLRYINLPFGLSVMAVAVKP